MISRQPKLPSSFGNDHFCSVFMKLLPELLGFQCHFGIILNIVIFGGRRPRGKSTKWKSRKKARVSVCRVKTVGGPKAWEPRWHGAGACRRRLKEAGEAEVGPWDERWRKSHRALIRSARRHHMHASPLISHTSLLGSEILLHVSRVFYH